MVAVVVFTCSIYPQVTKAPISVSTSTLPIAESGTSTSLGGSVPQISVAVSPEVTPVESISPTTQAFQTARLDSEGVLYEEYRSRRTRVLICLEIAKRLSVGPLGITDLALLTRLNFSQTRHYLDEMLEANLVEERLRDEGRKYHLTKRGMLFLRSGETTIQFLEPEKLGGSRFSEIVNDVS